LLAFGFYLQAYLSGIIGVRKDLERIREECYLQGDQVPELKFD